MTAEPGPERVREWVTDFPNVAAWALADRDRLVAENAALRGLEREPELPTGEVSELERDRMVMAWGPHVVGEPAADRLMRSLDYRLSPPGTVPLAKDQVAVVLHALADHTALVAALTYRRDVDSPWPDALSVGRWLHDAADQLERGLS